MPDDHDDPNRRTNVDPVRQADSRSTQPTDESDEDPDSEVEPEPESESEPEQESESESGPIPTHGETIDLSSEGEKKPPHSDVPIAPEVQREIDEYYRNKELEEQREKERQEHDEDADPDPPTQDDRSKRSQSATETGDPNSNPSPNPNLDTDASTATSTDLEADTESETEPSSQSPLDTDRDLGIEDVDPGDIDIEELENQEWTLGEAQDDKLIKLGDMKFLLSEEDADDEVINAIHKARAQGDGSNMSAVYYAAAQIAVKAPQITEERWDEGMTATQRMALGTRCLQYLNGDF